MEQGVSANVNWPVVAGLGVTAAVLFYALYIVNTQLQQADSLLGGAAGDIQSVISPFTSAFTSLKDLITGDNSSNSPDD